MNFIVLPSQALCDTNTSPLLLSEQSQCASVIRVEEILRNHLEEWLREDDVTILVFVVRVALRVMNSELSIEYKHTEVRFA